MMMTLKWIQPQNDDDLKHEEDLQHEYDPKDENYPKNEDGASPLLLVKTFIDIFFIFVILPFDFFFIVMEVFRS